MAPAARPTRSYIMATQKNTGKGDSGSTSSNTKKSSGKK
jgi:hypothetical protein